jgi:hypothetical protein
MRFSDLGLILGFGKNTNGLKLYQPVFSRYFSPVITLSGAFVTQIQIEYL